MTSSPLTEHEIAEGIICYRGVLPNNIRVLLTKMPHVQAVSVNVTVDAGARDEAPEESGVAHFLEHMAFKGTKTRTALDIAQEFDAIGGRSNAGTGRENTVYYAKVLKEHAGDALEILADILQNSVYSREETEKERDVILQEIFMTRDTPDDYVFDMYQEACYGDSRMGRSILGTEELVSGYTGEDLRRFMTSKYYGERIVISLAGALEPQEMFARVNDLFSGFAAKGSYTRPKAEHFTAETRLITRELDQAHVVFGVPSASSKDPHYRAVQLAGLILGGGMSSRLFQEVREKRGLAYSVSSFPWSFADSGVFSLYGGTSPEKTEEMIKVMLGEIEKLTDTGPEAEELARAKRQVRASVLMEQEKSGFLADYVTRRQQVHNDMKPLAELLAKMESITAEDIKQAAAAFAESFAKENALACIGTETATKAAEKALRR